MKKYQPFHQLSWNILFYIVIIYSTAIAQETPDEFNKVLEAHGGLDNWQAKGSLAYHVESMSAGKKNLEEYIINLHTRHEKIVGDNYEMGFDGKEYWQWVKDEKMDEKNPRFFTNLQFYFFAMPFVLADPGVNIESLGLKEVEGKPYHGFKATFDAGVGEAPEDQYILYVERESYQLTYLLYSVTFFNKERANSYSARAYKDWHEVDGLLVPKEIIRHKWDNENDRLGEEVGIVRYPFVEFKEEIPDEGTFSPPTQAKTEPK